MSSDNHHGEHTDGILEADHKVPGYFYLLYFGLILWGVIFTAYYLFSGWSSSQEFEEKMAAHSGAQVETAAPAVAVVPSPKATIDAAALFASNCAGCHGDDGKGGFGPDLSRSSYEYGKDPVSVTTSIANGRGDKMPAFGGRLSSAEVAALVNFSRQL
jgi:cytochrome c oxidase cbb3-type subunit 3